MTQRACQDWREPDTFLEFHPAFPETGVRLDFTFNWQKPTEIASRIQSIMPPDTAGAFSAFGWDAVNVVVQGLVELEERPNLVKLTKYIEGGIEPVLEAHAAPLLRARARRRLARTAGDEEAAARRAPRQHQAARPRRPAPTCMAFVAYYEHHVAQSQRNKVHRRAGAHLPPQPRALPEDHRQPAAGAVDADLGRPRAAACRPSPSMPTTAGRS